MTDEAPEGSGALGAPEAPDPDEAQRAIEYCYDQGWSDGLPLVPVSRPLLDRFLATTDKEPDEIIGSLEQVGRDVDVRTAAINAAMAGCKPEYFPVVLAAFDALMRERAARGGGFQSTSGPAPLIVVNGPIRKELGFNTAGGAFGPGFRPNMTIPRAVGLIVRNAFGIHPHVLEQATQGVPGRLVDLRRGERGRIPLGAVRRERRRGWRRLGRVRHAHPHDGVRRQPAHPEPRGRAARLPGHDLPDRLADLPAVVGGAGAVPRARADAFAAAGMSKADVQNWLLERCGRTGA